MSTPNEASPAGPAAGPATAPPAPGRKASLVYNALLRTAWLRRRGGRGGNLWKRAWDAYADRFPQPVSTLVHGRRAVLNAANNYPVMARVVPRFNNPVVELAYRTFKAAGRPIRFVDVGAATGDTILLLKASCPDMIGAFACVDGDPEFFGYLRQNLAAFPDGRLICSMLAASTEAVPELVRTHAGTASAQGEASVAAAPLDDVLAGAGVGPVDVLKVDVDGFDGRVLQGAGRVLREDRPGVIFEWHPKLYAKTGTDFLASFHAVAAAGYDRFVWYNNYGEFSHFMRGVDPATVRMYERLCLEGRVHVDKHFDVVALHADSPLSEVDLAEQTYAEGHKSQF